MNIATQGASMKVLKTDWVEYTDGNTKCRIRARYGIDPVFAERNHQDPYFSLTCEIDEKRANNWYDVGGGAAHALIAKHLPALAPLVKWHLCGVETGPMHYLANAMLWFDIAAGRKENGKYGPEPLPAFLSTVVYGALPGDAAFDFASRKAESFEREVVELWLKNRLPELLTTFRNEMTTAGVL